jgi:hypothetical protein
VWLLIFTFAIAVVVVVASGGRFREIANLHITASWLLFTGLAIQIGLEFLDLPKNEIDTFGYGFLMASYALILAFCIANLPVRGFGVIAIGVALNTLVIGLNQGMPSVPIGNDAHGNRIQKPVEQTVKHRPERHGDLLRVLDDRIVLPKPFDEVESFGDLVISVGICEFAYTATRRRRRRLRPA